MLFSAGNSFNGIPLSLHIHDIIPRFSLHSDTKSEGYAIKKTKGSRTKYAVFRFYFIGAV